VQLRRQLRHRSKNADVARKEMIAKKRGIPVDLVLSPGQVELEMKKLAILREVRFNLCGTGMHETIISMEASNEHALYIPRYKTEKLQRSFKYQRVKMWNSIPVSIQTIIFTGFKKNYKQMLINKYVIN